MTQRAKPDLVVLDIDDTMNLLRAEIVRIGLNRFGIDRPWQTWGSYRWTEIFPGVSVKDWHQAMIEERSLERALPEPGLRDVLARLESLNVRVEAWTARAWHPEGSGISVEWLKQHGLRDPLVRLFNLDERKGRLCQVLGLTPALAVDDSPEHLASIRAASPNTRCVLIDQPWNRHDNEFTRVRAIGEAVDLLYRADVQAPHRSTVFAPG